MYPLLNGTLAGQDLAYILVYENQITNGWLGIMLVFSFFLVVLIGSLFVQFRFSGRVKPETSFLAASFATLGWTVILMQRNGIVPTEVLLIIILFNIIGIIWNAMGSD